MDELYSHNAVIDFICKSEKQLLYGPSLVSCYDGEWNPQQVPTCEGEDFSLGSLVKCSDMRRNA